MRLHRTASDGLQYVAVTDQDDWPKRLAVHVGQQIRRYRDAENVLARELADRTEELGHRVETNVITNLEVGRRTSVRVADLLALAAALQIPPALLICPVGAAGEIEPLPGWSVDPWTGFEWTTGFEAGSESRMTVEAMNAIRTYHAHWQRLLPLRSRLTAPGSDDERHQALRLGAVRDEMRAAGWSPPPIPEAVERLIADAAAWEAGRRGTSDDET